MSSFLVVAWTQHPDLIPTEVGCVVPEPDEPSIIRQRPLFLWAEEIIHSKQDTLHFRVFIELLEVHDFLLCSDDSSSEDNDLWFDLNRSYTIRPGLTSSTSPLGPHQSVCHGRVWAVVQSGHAAHHHQRLWLRRRPHNPQLHTSPPRHGCGAGVHARQRYTALDHIF
jgi:hypothetical protein